MGIRAAQGVQEAVWKGIEHDARVQLRQRGRFAVLWQPRLLQQQIGFFQSGDEPLRAFRVFFLQVGKGADRNCQSHHELL
ncbi:hypothetical protein D3C81_1955360 [compost metagenome]